MPWYIYSISAALSWGFLYVLMEILIRRGINPISVVFVFVPVYTISMIITMFTNNRILKDYKTIIDSNQLLVIILVISFLDLFANWCILTATKLKSASMTSMIEITYPFFILIFSIFLFKEFHFKWEYLLGLGLITTGSLLIIIKS